MINNKVLAIILGGGQGSRLHPLTENRSKPAVPIAGKYRLADIPISNCFNAAINRRFVLTHLIPGSLNLHIKDRFIFIFLVVPLWMCWLQNKHPITKVGFKELPMP